MEAAKRAAAKRAAAEEAAGTASIALTERFSARPADLFACFTDARRVMAFTQAPAEVCSLCHAWLWPGPGLPLVMARMLCCAPIQGGHVLVVREGCVCVLRQCNAVLWERQAASCRKMRCCAGLGLLNLCQCLTARLARHLGPQVGPEVSAHSCSQKHSEFWRLQMELHGGRPGCVAV